MDYAVRLTGTASRRYTAWPDHGVPATTEELLKFRHTVRESFESSSGPIITHCSAGVGRTGTFIGLDRYLDSCTELDDSLTVLDVVKNMRKCRNFMVQAQAQFEYLYMACYDGLVVLLEKVGGLASICTGAHSTRARLAESLTPLSYPDPGEP